MSVAEIKEQAIQEVQRASRGASVNSFIGSASGYIALARLCELSGDLKGAFSALTKAAAYTQVFMDTADLEAEIVPGKRGMLWKEFIEFQQVSCSPLSHSSACIFIIALFSVKAATLRSAHKLWKVDCLRSCLSHNARTPYQPATIGTRINVRS